VQPITIVMYHYVRDLERTRYPRIKGLRLAAFRQQLAYMQRFHHFVTVKDLIAALDGAPLPSNPAVLTFDDGFADHFQSVFPILSHRKIEGCFFPPCHPILHNTVLDVHKIHFILASTDEEKLFPVVMDALNAYRDQLSLPSNDAIFAELSVGSRFDSPKVTCIKQLLQHYLPEQERHAIVQSLFARFVSADEATFSAELYMTPDQLQCMSASGMYIGSHGFRHVWLNKVDAQTQIEEVDRSLELLQQIGAPTRQWVFSYPYGAYNQSLIDAAKQRGCALGLTTEVGLATLDTDHAYTLARLDTNDLPRTDTAEPSHWTQQAMS
jgi:peptidoglycan/xylan/chitin deacetylase (PgdA/CDA1 family)